MSYTIYHYPKCGKSRQTLKLLEENNIKPKVVEYFSNPLNSKELKEVIQKLGIQADDLLRKNETLFKENFKGKNLTADEWIKVMIENPQLMERPIVVKDKKAVLGRPPENVLTLISEK
jgi:arsenate reductase